MKKYIILFLAVSSSAAFGQSKTVHKSITNDGNAISIHVSGTIDGDNFDFDRTFDISSLDKIAKLIFKDKNLDSPDVDVSGIPEQPSFPKAPKSEVAVHAEETATYDNQVKNLSSDTKKSFSKEVRYNSECGELFLRYKYEKDGEEYEYELTINVKSKSETERMYIIEETERELGLTTIQ